MHQPTTKIKELKQMLNIAYKYCDKTLVRQIQAILVKESLKIEVQRTGKRLRLKLNKYSGGYKAGRWIKQIHSDINEQ